MLGHTVLVYPHPKGPRDLPVVGLVTHINVEGDKPSVDVVTFPPGNNPKHRGAIRYVPTVVDAIPGYRGNFYCTPLVPPITTLNFVPTDGKLFTEGERQAIADAKDGDVVLIGGTAMAGPAEGSVAAFSSATKPKPTRKPTR